MLVINESRQGRSRTGDADRGHGRVVNKACGCTATNSLKTKTPWRRSSTTSFARANMRLYKQGREALDLSQGGTRPKCGAESLGLCGAGRGGGSGDSVRTQRLPGSSTFSWMLQSLAIWRFAGSRGRKPGREGDPTSQALWWHSVVSTVCLLNLAGWHCQNLVDVPMPEIKIKI